MRIKNAGTSKMLNVAYNTNVAIDILHADMDVTRNIGVQNIDAIIDIPTNAHLSIRVSMN